MERIGPITLVTVEGSPNYYVRYRKNGRQVVRSLATDDILVARQKARELADTLEARVIRRSADCSFRRFAIETIEDDRKKVMRGERSPSLVEDGEQIYRCYLEITLASKDVRQVDYRVLKRLVDRWTDEELASATIRKILVWVSKTLKTAIQAGTLHAIPPMPKVENRQSVRGWFTPDEYRLLLRECQKHERLKTKVRTQVITSELRYFVSLMINTFLRPSDVKLLRHRHVEVVRSDAATYLRISTDFSKTELSPIVSMAIAVPIYQKLTALQAGRGYGRPNDFVFFPQYRNRQYALELIRRQFIKVCSTAGLLVSKAGEPRTLYSLRHSAISFRLLQGDKVDLLTLARNARTSVEMIDRFYAKHLTAEMNVDQLQSSR
jgi:hypothetical protein